jgi:hypothetical protein
VSAPPARYAWVARIEAAPFIGPVSASGSDLENSAANVEQWSIAINDAVADNVDRVAYLSFRAKISDFCKTLILMLK